MTVSLIGIFKGNKINYHKETGILMVTGAELFTLSME